MSEQLSYCPRCGGPLRGSRTTFMFYGGGNCMACDDCEIAWSIGIDEDETNIMYAQAEPKGVEE